MDNVFKALVVLLLVALVFVAHRFSENNRYEMVVTEDGQVLLDTRTGEAYMYVPSNESVEGRRIKEWVIGIKAKQAPDQANTKTRSITERVFSYPVPTHF